LRSALDLDLFQRIKAAKEPPSIAQLVSDYKTYDPYILLAVERLASCLNATIFFTTCSPFTVNETKSFSTARYIYSGIKAAKEPPSIAQLVSDYKTYDPYILRLLVLALSEYMYLAVG
jgi:hypothetical protein